MLHATLSSRSSPVLRNKLQRGILWLAVCGSALLLGGCGGGGDAGSNDGTLEINAVVADQPLGTTFVPGVVGSIDLSAGQTIELDASEPVDWAFSVDGGPLFGNGTTVLYGGLALTETAVSSSRVVLQTRVTGGYVSPVTITMTATSTLDAAAVATVRLIVH